jgi:hypothetical protein
MRYTLNQIIAKLESIASSHQQINSFAIGDLSDLLKGNRNYPLMYVVLLPSSYQDKEFRLNLSVLLMDLVDNGKANENEVLSDMLLIASDVRALLMAPENASLYLIDKNSTVDPFTERFEDDVAGWNINITFRIMDLMDRCRIPLNS